MNQQTFSVHNILNFKILCSKIAFLSYLRNQYKYFYSEKKDIIDFKIQVSPFRIKKNNYIKKENFLISKNSIYWKDQRKLGRWEVLIEGFETDKIDIKFWGNKLSLKYLCMYVIDPVINIFLVRNGHVLLHASAISLDKKVFVSCAYPGCGKSSIAMYFINRFQAKYMSDEYVILSESADVLSFVMPIAVFDYNSSIIQSARKNISTFILFLFWIKKILRKISFNQLKPPTYLNLNNIYPNAEIESKGTLENFMILEKSMGKNIEYEDINIEIMVTEVEKINLFQFKYFNNIMNHYLSINPYSKVNDIKLKQNKVLMSAFKKKKNYMKFYMPDFSKIRDEDFNIVLKKCGVKNAIK
jgi:hypothetical protein